MTCIGPSFDVLFVEVALEHSDSARIPELRISLRRIP
jgi:hypothetical protein